MYNENIDYNIYYFNVFSNINTKRKYKMIIMNSDQVPEAIYKMLWLFYSNYYMLLCNQRGGNITLIKVMCKYDMFACIDM